MIQRYKDLLYFQSICFLSFHPTSLSALSAHFVVYLCTYEHEQKEKFIIKEQRICEKRRKKTNLWEGLQGER